MNDLKIKTNDIVRCTTKLEHLTLDKEYKALYASDTGVTVCCDIGEDYSYPIEAFTKVPTKELTGGLVNYYLVHVKHPQRPEQVPYQAECEDIIRALNMTFDEGCEFKAIWRTAAARMGNGKPNQEARYDAEKRVHYAKASLRQYLNQEK